MTDRPPRVGVYNKYWASRGGGERHSGMLAQVLSHAGAAVDLIGHADVDLDALTEYLGLDLSKCAVRVVPDIGDSGLSGMTAEYDLFINGSYMSKLEAQARKAVYLCYFPTPADHDLARWQRRAIRLVGRLASSGGTFTSLNWGIGWFPAEGGRRRMWTWTNGDGILHFAGGDDVHLRLDIACLGSEPTELRVTLDDDVLLAVTAGDRFRTEHLTVPASLRPRTVRFRSETFTPGGTDHRQLGVAVSRMYFSGRGIRLAERLGYRFPWLLRDAQDIGFLDTYDVVLANSQFTADWITKLWHRPADVVYPPIQVDRFHPASVRTKSIITVGRFFAPGHGHSKRQLEQVQTFAEIVRSGHLTDWTLHVVGGCEPWQQGYLDEVRAAAAGLPVEIHANAPRHLLEQLMSTAAIEWSATGYGEDEAKAPWAAEHFGMTTVEAMAGGCVPIVIDKAGQREIVREGVDGYRWTSLDQLVQRTLQVAHDDSLRAQLAASAADRAQQYSDEAFARNLLDIVERHELL